MHGLQKTRVLFEEKKIQNYEKHHFVENKTEVMQHVLKTQ